MGEWLAEAVDSWWSPLARLGLYVYESETLTGQVLTFWAIVAAILSYVGVSLLGPRREFNLDKLLHRGAYAVEEDQVAEREQPTFLEKLGFTREFSGRDKWVTWITISWPLVWTLIFAVGTAYCLIYPVSARAWLEYWRVWTWIIFGVAAVVVVWFAIGGFLDLRRMFRRLRDYEADERDDGRVEQA